MGWSATGSGPEVENADQGEQATRSVDVKFDLAAETFLKNARALVVNASPRHVDRLDLARRKPLDRIEVTLADLVIVFHDLTKRSQREAELDGRLVRFRANIKDEKPVIDGQLKPVGSRRHLSGVRRRDRERVVLQQIEDRNPTLLLGSALSSISMCTIRDISAEIREAPVFSIGKQLESLFGDPGNCSCTVRSAPSQAGDAHSNGPIGATAVPTGSDLHANPWPFGRHSAPRGEGGSRRSAQADDGLSTRHPASGVAVCLLQSDGTTGSTGPAGN